MLMLIFAAMAFAIATFTLGIKVLDRATDSKNTLASPITIALFCASSLAAGPIVFNVMPNLSQLYIALLPMIFWVLLPSLWLYHQSLIATEEWQWTKASAKHFLPLPAIAVIVLLVALLPENEFEQMFFSDAALQSRYAQVVAIAFFIAILGWCVMSVFYVIGIIKNTHHYHRHIRQTYAHEQGKTLWWVQGLSLLIIFTWGYAIVVLAVDNQLRDYGLSEMGVVLLLLLNVWVLSSCALAQRPGFADVYTKMQASTNESAPETSKYQRSALSESDRARIAEKLKRALTEDKIFMDPDVNLYKLAETLGIQSQYVTQTLSLQLNTTFFDFINQARIEAAKPMLLNSNETVLNIAFAVGFNARSSFYKAFKACTGTTPTAFKQLNK